MKLAFSVDGRPASTRHGTSKNSKPSMHPANAIAARVGFSVSTLS